MGLLDYVDYFLKKKKIVIPIIAVTALFVAVCAVAAYYLSKITFDDGSQAAPSPSVSSQEQVSESESESEPDHQEIDGLVLNSQQQSALDSADEQIKTNLSDSKIWKSESVINILLAGIDQASGVFAHGRSDAMILVSVNKVNKIVKLVSLSRAAYVSIPGYSNTRLSHAHGYGGAGLMLKTIEQNYKIAINNYVSVGFTAFVKIVDILGGCRIELTAAEVNALKSKLYENGLTPKGAGTYLLNGKLALEYVRLRRIDTDKDRTARQRKLLTSLMSSVKAMGFTQVKNILDSVLSLVTTNLTKSEILQYGFTSFTKYLNWPMSQDVLPNKPSPLTLVDGFEVLIIDWGHETRYIHSLLYDGVSDINYK